MYNNIWMQRGKRRSRHFFIDCLINQKTG